MQLADSVGGAEVMVEPVHVVVQEPDSNGNAMRVGRPLVETVNTLEGACRSGVELADAVVGGKVVSHSAHGGRTVGETVTCGKETGLCASLAKVGDSSKGTSRQAGGVVVAGEAGVEVVVMGEDQAFGVNGGVRAPLAQDMERPAAEAGRLNSEPGNSRPGGREASGANEHVAADDGWDDNTRVGEGADGETGSNLGESRLLFFLSFFRFEMTSVLTLYN